MASVPVAAMSANPLHITIRFTTSIPDLLLDIPKPAGTTVVSLKHLIRSKLSHPTSTHRLRLIYSGKILQDSSYLSTVLKIPQPPPRATPDRKGKGKGPEYDPPPRVYINCSIGDELSASELAAEAAAAASSTTASSLEIDTAVDGTGKVDRVSQANTTTAAPRGFDRLLTAGFTPAEVGQLRLQFMSIQSSINTPDTMPSPTTLRNMEDAWIDDNGPTADGGSMAEADIAGGALDDLLWGSFIGFLWPLGAVTWLSREEGVWSPRRQTAVLSGFMLCLAFGLLNVLG